MSNRTPGAYGPTDGLSYDPTDEIYWNEDALQKEIDRVFEVCHGCRMCFKFCDSFPDLFRFIDDNHDGRAEAVTEHETAQVMDSCFQCKLCEVQCPYTPRDGHRFQLDFPKLVHRYHAVQTRKRGGPRLRDRILGNPEATGSMARASLGMANVMNRVGAHRWFMEKLIGIHRQKQLPEFAASTFDRWAEDQGWVTDEPGGEVVLFPTCYVNDCEPQLGRDTVEVMQRNQVDLRCTRGLKCCGMPAWESGDLEGLRRRASSNLRVLEPFVDAGAKVAAINPTCSMMLRIEYPDLVEPSDRERAHKVAEAVRDPAEHIWDIRKEDRFNTDFKSNPGPAIAYHAPCHLRAQARGFRGRDLLRKAGATQISMVSECCGHDGTHAMKVDGFDRSIRVGQKAFDGMKEGEAPVWSTDCPLAAIQFEQHAGVKPLHPMTILARAYRGEPIAGDELAASPEQKEPTSQPKETQED